MKYVSTNGESSTGSFSSALLKGLAPDKGLFMPEAFPSISLEEIKSFKEKDYWEIAFSVLNKLINSESVEIPEDDLKRICRDAYDFPVPLEKLNKNIYLMRLDQGPTASFKDFAARFMGRAMQYFIAKENRKLRILVATSGDTGGAIADAFSGLENIEVFVLFPKKEVTERQRKQMTTVGGNVKAIALEGKFDNCQEFVKKAFVDPDLKQLNLSSANSINIGRLLPQSVYYFYAYAKLASENSDKVIFSVPSGNFGDLMGGLIAKNMGLPVKKFIAAVNENNEFPEFLKTGNYFPLSPSKKCISNAMNVGHPSNLARLVALYNGRMDEKGEITKMPDMEKMRERIYSTSVSDSETKQEIKQIFEKYKSVIEPHGAVGVFALQKYLEENKDESISVCLQTADPAKFPEVLEELNIKVALPEKLKMQMKKKESFAEIQNNYEEFKKLLLQNH